MCFKKHLTSLLVLVILGKGEEQMVSFVFKLVERVLEKCELEGRETSKLQDL